jgi:hypothetical protein
MEVNRPDCIIKGKRLLRIYRTAIIWVHADINGKNTSLNSISPGLRIASPILDLIQESPGVFEYPEKFVTVIRSTYGFIDSMCLGSAKHRPMHGDACVGQDYCNGQYSSTR